MKRVWGLLLFAISLPLAAQEEITSKHPDWSPDGRSLAFEATVGGESNVYVAEIASGDASQITFTRKMDSYPRFMPDGQSIVWLSRRYGKFSVHSTAINDLDARDFSTESEAEILEPAVSPDGRHIAFRALLPESAEIMVADVDGRNLRRLTFNEVEDGFPSFSSDGTAIFFHRQVDEFKQIFAMTLADASETQLTFGRYNSAHAHQSPDGTSIVFDAEAGDDRNVFKMDMDRRAVIQLTDAPGRDGYPKWSPDGNNIAFHSAREGMTRVYIMRADGKNQEPFRFHVDAADRLEHCFKQRSDLVR